MLLDNLASVLETAGVGTVKTAGNSPTWPIYKGGRAPAAPNANLIWLSEYALGGLIDEMGATVGYAPLEEVGLNVQVRAPQDSYAAGRSKCDAVTAALHKYAGTVSGVRYALVMQKGTPRYVSRDGDAAHVFSLNFEVTKEQG